MKRNEIHANLWAGKKAIFEMLHTIFSSTEFSEYNQIDIVGLYSGNVPAQDTNIKTNSYIFSLAEQKYKLEAKLLPGGNALLFQTYFQDREGDHKIGTEFTWRRIEEISFISWIDILGSFGQQKNMQFSLCFLRDREKPVIHKDYGQYIKALWQNIVKLEEELYGPILNAKPQ